MKEVGAEAFLWCALFILPAQDEGMQGTAALGHVHVQPFHIMTATHMVFGEAVALGEDGITSAGRPIILGFAITEARLGEAAHVFLIFPVRIVQSTLDALNKHVADRLERCLDVRVKLPTWL
jgi:hypothetical protein